MHRPWGEGAPWQEKGGPGLIQVTEQKGCLGWAESFLKHQEVERGNSHALHKGRNTTWEFWKTPCPGGAVSFFSRHPCHPWTFTGDCTVQTVYMLFGAIFQHTPGASMFRLRTECCFRNLALSHGEVKGDGPSLTVPTAHRPLVTSAASPPSQALPGQWPSPALAPTPHPFLYPFARNAHKGLNPYVCLPHSTLSSQQSSHLINSYCPELGCSGNA